MVNCECCSEFKTDSEITSVSIYHPFYEEAEKDFNKLQEEGKKVIVSLTASGMGFEHSFDIWYK